MTNTHATRSNTHIFFGYCEHTRCDEMLLDEAHGFIYSSKCGDGKLWYGMSLFIGDVIKYE